MALLFVIMEFDFITTFIGDRLTKILKSGSDKITDEISQMANNRILEYLFAEYKSNYKTKTFLHRTDPIELKKIYQPLYLRRAPLTIVRNSKNIDSIESFPRIGTRHLKYLFSNDVNCITIIGTAGSGKSTLVKYLFVDSIKNNYKIPIKIELRYLNNYDGDLLTYITDEIIKFNKIAEKDTIVERLLNSGKFVFFLDGYDEISSNKKDIITKDINRITRRYYNNKYLLTSRPFAVDMLEKFHNFEICQLSLEEIRLFVRKQFGNRQKELSDKIIESINNNDNNAYKSFLSNPLLLSMFILTYQTDSNIPAKRSDYYYQVFNALYSGHDTLAKLGYVREKLSGLSKDNIIELLKRFSVKSFFDQKISFPISYFDNEILNIKKQLSLNFRNEDLLNDLKTAIGIFAEDGINITYPHRSLQEFFSAFFVSTLPIDSKIIFYNKLCSLFENYTLVNFDCLNFFILLKEMDSIVFSEHFLVPLLSIIKHRAQNTQTFIEFIKSDENLLFIAIKSIAFIFDTKMQSDFDEMYKNYRDKISILRERISINDDIFRVKSINIYYNEVIPFLKGYDYDKIISNICEEVDNLKKNNSKFIEDLLPFSNE